MLQPFLHAAGQSTVVVVPACTEQPQEAAQSTPPPQELRPEHLTLQKPGPQLIWPAQVPSALQLTVHAAARVQSMAPGHSSFVSHLIAQG